MIYNNYVFDKEILENSLSPSKDFKSPIQILYKKYQKYAYIIKNFPERIIDTFGGMDIFMNYPIIDFVYLNHMGCTSYLDRFKKSDLGDNSIVIGIDTYRRPFVSLKIQFEYDLESVPEEELEYYSISNGKSSGVVTLFQRYTDSPNNWTTGSCYCSCMDIFQSGMLRFETYLIIKEFIKNKKVKIRDKIIKLI
jgi:hypothetical protein